MTNHPSRKGVSNSMVSALLISLTLNLAVAQSAVPVDFSGTWAPVAPPQAGSSSGVAGLPPSDLTIRQTKTSIEIDRTAFGQVTTLKYALDGQPSKNRSGAVVTVTTTTWAGKMLVTVGKASQTTSQGYDEWTIKETRSINSKGAMVVESTHTGQDGKVTTGTLTYTRRRSRP
jgi:hypothetical protein